MVTDRPGLALGIITADCAPILLADPEAGVIGAAHAGWRGAMMGVLEATVAAMAGLGASPAAIAAAIGPCIGQASLRGRGGSARRLLWPERRKTAASSRTGNARTDGNSISAGYCESRLMLAGVEQIERIEADTAPDEARFFSHRRRTLAGGGPIGHQISIIGLAG